MLSSLDAVIRLRCSVSDRGSARRGGLLPAVGSVAVFQTGLNQVGNGCPGLGSPAVLLFARPRLRGGSAGLSGSGICWVMIKVVQRSVCSRRSLWARIDRRRRVHPGDGDPGQWI